MHDDVVSVEVTNMLLVDDAAELSLSRERSFKLGQDLNLNKSILDFLDSAVHDVSFSWDEVELLKQLAFFILHRDLLV